MQTASTPQQRLQLSEPAPALRLWPAHERSIGPARHWLIATLAEWTMGELADTAALVLSELLTNAVQHAGRSDDEVIGSEIGVRFVRLDGALRIEVHDVSERPPELRTRPAECPECLDERGRGLLLVTALTAGQWGVSPREGLGKLIWAHVPVSPEETRDALDALIRDHEERHGTITEKEIAAAEAELYGEGDGTRTAT
jgi:anti-sigma regulatory factor (Ser/Thr protein kinase)